MMESKLCIRCKEEINPLRVKALPNTMTCVDCSTVGAKRGVSMMYGEKDHTWTDMVIMDPREFEIFEAKQAYLTTPEPKDENEEEDDDKAEEEDNLEDWDNTLLDGLEDL
jgi:hypothetical protein